MADNTKRLVFSFIQFLNDQLGSGRLSAGSQEGLEVAVQCLETAFEVSADDQSLAVSPTLPEIFADAAAKLPVAAAPAPTRAASNAAAMPTDQQVAEAEQLKTDGNAQMQVENFAAAVELYSKAIALSPRNAVYYGNRAAAHGKLGNHAGAVQDCEAAIRVDPAYSKAYGRMGTALTSLNRHADALHFYRKALELDPGNQTYRSNLAIAEQRAQQQQTPPPHPGPGPGPADFSSIFNNVELRNMATSLMSNPQVSSLMNNPQVQQLVSGLSGAFGSMGGAGPPTGGAAEGGAPTTDGGSGQAS